jgi:hypothetical protein
MLYWIHLMPPLVVLTEYNMSGIVIVALGNSLYGNLAFNLALSLKANEPTIPIALFCNDTAIARLKERHKGYFDHIIKVDPSDYLVDGKPQYQRVKCCVNKYTPFEKNLYIDADTLWLPNHKPSKLMEQIGDISFTALNNGGKYLCSTLKEVRNGYTWWGNPEVITREWGLTTELWQLQTTMFFFQKSKTEQYFKDCLRVYDTKDISVIGWANGKPDEYCFNVACALNGLYPHIYDWMPVYIQSLCGGRVVPKIAELEENYWAISTVGHRINEKVALLYNNLLNKYCILKSIPDRFYHVNKGELLPERKNG